MPTRVSLAELIDTDIPLRPDEAVAIVREICRQHAAHELRGIPNATVIRLTQDGRIAVEGPVSRDQDPVRAAALLLSELLPGFQTPTGFKVPGGLRLVLARATRALDLPPFAGIDEFSAALDRFAAPDLPATARRLFETFAAQQSARVEPGDVTISDIRRARRATGLSLDDVSRGAGIPAALLRELEWGYLRNWRADERGREDLRRYATAAGVDEDLVLSVAWPLIEAAAAEPIVVDAVPAASQEDWALVPAPAHELPVPIEAPARKPRVPLAGHRWVLALAAAVLLVVTALATGWDRPTPPGSATPPGPAAPSGPAPASATVVAAVPRTEVVEARPAATSGSAVVKKDVQRASLVKPAGQRSPRTADRPKPSRAKARPAPAPPPQRKSFFKRELFRIVIK